MAVSNDSFAVSQTKYAPKMNIPGTIRSSRFEWLPSVPEGCGVTQVANNKQHVQGVMAYAHGALRQSANQLVNGK
jgi:hypothetical protein